MKRRAWLGALLFNILLSASVTWAVLAWWSATHPCPRLTPMPISVPSVEVTAVTTPSFGYVVQPGDTWEAVAARFGLTASELRFFNGRPVDAPLTPGETLRIPGTPRPSPTVVAGVTIVAIPGAGSLADEHVRLRHQGTEAVNLAGWRLEDADGWQFVFPDLVLYPDGVLRIWTRAGTATAEDLFWGLEQPVWSPGEEARLIAPDGTVVARYRVP